MNLRIRLVLLLASLLAISPACITADDKTAMSLQTTYERALQQSESLKIKQEEVKAAQARYDQAMAVLYPNLHFISTQLVRDSTNTNFDSGQNDSNVRARSQHPFQTNFQVTQPLYTGNRNVYLAEAAEFDVRAVDFDQQRFAQQLYTDVAQLFHQIILFQKDLVLFSKTEKVLNERVDELQQFLKLGKSRESEIIAANTDVADLHAAREVTQGSLSASREMLAFLTGIPSSEIALQDGKELIATAPLDILVSQGSSRLDVRAAEARQESAAKQSKAADRLGWPTISLEGNYSPYQDPDTSADANLLLRFDLPLYEGGALKARAAEQQAKLRASQLSVAEGRRIAEREIRVAYSDLQTSKGEVTRVQELVESTVKNYESQRRDYSLGVVTNLDVLQAIRARYEAERRLIVSESALQLNYAKLKVAVGDLQ